MIQLAWRFLMFQPDSALARWYKERTAGARGSVRVRQAKLQPVKVRPG
jgi:transposase